MTAEQLSTKFSVLGRALPLRYMDGTVWPLCWRPTALANTNGYCHFCLMLVGPFGGWTKTGTKEIGLQASVMTDTLVEGIDNIYFW